MLLCKRTGLALRTTKMSAGRNSSALAGPKRNNHLKSCRFTNYLIKSHLHKCASTE